jgi:DNA-binding transcriptional LysR family regulator
MPYGIQQSTISSQILQLEDKLGKNLFQRRPFELTAEGRLLFESIEPFFSSLDGLAGRLRGGAEKHLRTACPEIVQRDYPAYELASLELITRYVASGFGVGLSLDIPGAGQPPGVRALPLPGFPEILFGGFTNGPPGELANRFLDEAVNLANSMLTRDAGG